MATITSLGVGSGLDLTGLLDQLQEAERGKLAPITLQKKTAAGENFCLRAAANIAKQLSRCCSETQRPEALPKPFRERAWRCH